MLNIVNAYQGVAIKILLISNVEGGSDELLAAADLEGSTIVAKETKGDVKAMVKYAVGLFAQGRYDAIVALADNPIGANIAFNKYEDMRALVCNSAEDAKSAEENGVNVLVLKSENAGLMESIIGTFSKGKGPQLRIRLPKMQQKVQQIQEPKPQPTTLQVKRPPPQPAPVKKEYVEEPDLPKRPGVRGWIKDKLGIIDVENFESPKQKKEKKPAKG